MSISDYYQNIDLYRFSKGEFATPSSYAKLQTFKGLIQAPSSSKLFLNNKDTANIVAVLFCDNSMNSVIQNKDIVEYGGIRYLISGQQSQPLGVSGIEPEEGQHCEFNLEYANKGI